VNDPSTDDASIIDALRRGTGAGAAALYDRYAALLSRTVRRLMGADSEHDDMVQQVFVAALASAHRVRDPQALRGWLVTVAVNTVRSELRRRRYRRWIAPTADVHELTPEHYDDPEARELLARVYAILEKLGIDERIAFTLRYINGSSLEDVAAACGCSLATAKRRLKAAELRVQKLAAKEPALAVYMSRAFGGDT
jgi:RNA polymerase sigma-70 factor (ECF subfamily)